MPGRAVQPGQTRSDRHDESATKDASGRPEAGRTTNRPVAGSAQATGGRGTRSGARRGDSQVGTTPLIQVTKGFVRQIIQAAGLHILLELAVSHLGIKRGKPRSKLCKLLGQEVRDRPFNLFNGTLRGHPRSVHTADVVSFSAAYSMIAQESDLA